MSFSLESTEWHLTPNGWKKGTTEKDPNIVNKKENPPDRVLTCRYVEEQTSPFAKMNSYTEIIWKGSDEEIIEELKKEFGDCPRKLFSSEGN